MQFGRANLRSQLSNNNQKIQITWCYYVYQKIISESQHVLGLWYKTADWDIIVCVDQSFYNVYVSICGLLTDTLSSLVHSYSYNLTQRDALILKFSL
jgi:hypothetical protein